jgi:hypothetical protein
MQTTLTLNDAVSRIRPRSMSAVHVALLGETADIDAGHRRCHHPGGLTGHGDRA